MKRFLLITLKVIGIITLAALVFFMIYGIIFILKWPWWVGLIAFLGITGIIFAVFFIVKLWTRRREKRFVQQIIAQDEARLQSMEHAEKERSKELQARWKEAISALRSSHLKRMGNPLYVLPWYLIIGESGAGKTTAIRSARLSSPFTEVSRISGIAGTKNCDWWFFEQAILIDTAGRYAIPVDEGQDKKEWQEFLKLLAKYRKKEPLNGLIVAVAADKLLSAASGELGNDGISIRRRIDELMLALGAKFPVYIMVTKCDLIQGMNHLCEQLPEEALNQAMGFLNTDLSTDVKRFCEDAVATVSDHLRELRLILLHQQGGSKEVDPGLLLFPDEFAGIKGGLQAFLKGAFQENPYQETPLLRGIYFSSGRQEGNPYSRFLNSLGLLEAKEMLPGTDRGLFLHDFFSKILPTDRGLFAPTQRTVRWRQLTTNLGLVAWITLGLFACGLLTYSFYSNSKTLGEFNAQLPADFNQIVESRNSPAVLIASLDRLAKSIEAMNQHNRDRLLPTLGLDQSLQAEREMKKRFCDLFQAKLLNSIDKNMINSIDRLSRSGSPTMVLQHVTHLAERINLLNDRIEGTVFKILADEGLEGSQDALKRLEKYRRPVHWPGLPSVQNNKDDEQLKKRFISLYLHYLVWNDSLKELQQERRTLLTALERILNMRGTGLFWLVSWVNQSSSLEPVTLGTFWGGAALENRGPMIAPAFTRKGKEIIDDFLKRLEKSVPVTEKFTAAKKRFFQQYFSEYLKSWQSFAAAFAQGSQLLRSRDEAKQVAVRITQGKGPFLSFIKRVDYELKAVGFDSRSPGWIRLVNQFNVIMEHATDTGAPAPQGEKTLQEKLQGKLKEGQKQLDSLGQKISAWDTEQVLTPSLAPLVPVYRHYDNALRQIGLITQSQKAAFKLTYKTFAEEAAGDSPFFTIYQAIERMRSTLVSNDSSSSIFWRLVEGPALFTWQYALRETSCYLQKKWGETVLAEAAVVSGWDRENLLLGKNGLAWIFVEKTAAPFLTRTPYSGYRPKAVLDGVIPFSPEFLSFLSKGMSGKQTLALKKRYTINIEAKPTGTNRGARLHPRSTRLRLNCGQEVQELVNYQFKVSRPFVWTPGQCGDVILEIYVGDLVLKKYYTGDQAFIQFLKDFPGGEHTFSAEDFPQQQQALDRFGIKQITVAYVFHGHRDLLKRVTEVPRDAPQTICPCWE